MKINKILNVREKDNLDEKIGDLMLDAHISKALTSDIKSKIESPISEFIILEDVKVKELRNGVLNYQPIIGMVGAKFLLGPPKSETEPGIHSLNDPKALPYTEKELKLTPEYKQSKIGMQKDNKEIPINYQDGGAWQKLASTTYADLLQGAELLDESQVLNPISININERSGDKIKKVKLKEEQVVLSAQLIYLSQDKNKASDIKVTIPKNKLKDINLELVNKYNITALKEKEEKKPFYVGPLLPAAALIGVVALGLAYLGYQKGCNGEEETKVAKTEVKIEEKVEQLPSKLIEEENLRKLEVPNGGATKKPEIKLPPKERKRKTQDKKSDDKKLDLYAEDTGELPSQNNLPRKEIEVLPYLSGERSTLFVDYKEKFMDFYRDQLETRPNLEGQVKGRFIVDDYGRVSIHSITYNTLPENTLLGFKSLMNSLRVEESEENNQELNAPGVYKFAFKFNQKE